MKKNFLRIMCAVLALVMFAGVAPKNAYAASAVKAPKTVKIAVASGYASLSWSKVKGAKGYAIYRSVNGGSYKKIDEVKEVMYSDEETYKNGDKLSYYVKAYKKSGSKKVWGDKSKVVSLTYSTKDKYKNAKKIMKKYNMENGEESPKGTYNVVDLPGGDLSVIVGASYMEDQDAIGFTYIKYADDAMIMVVLTYAKDTDPCYVYTCSDLDSNIATGMFFVNPAKLTEDKKFKMSDAFLFEDETNGSIDHAAELTEAYKALNSFMKNYTSEVSGLSMSDLGFKKIK